MYDRTIGKSTRPQSKFYACRDRCVRVKLDIIVHNSIDRQTVLVTFCIVFLKDADDISIQIGFIFTDILKIANCPIFQFHFIDVPFFYYYPFYHIFS